MNTSLIGMNGLFFFSFSYNTTPHTEHEFTPHELVFGTKARLPQEIYEKKRRTDPVYNLEQYSRKI